MQTRLLTIMLGVVLAACAEAPDRAVSPTAPRTTTTDADVFDRYVAIGTSVSMGWQSDGLTASIQQQSWPAQVAAAAGRPMSLPLISGVGCRSPIAAPLALGRRESGEPVSPPPGVTLACDPLQSGIALPTRNVAIASATTQNVVQSTPASITDPFYQQLFGRVLPPGMTPLAAALSQAPTFVSVELGANELLGARTGVAIPGQTMFPYGPWTQLFDVVVSNVTRAAPKGLFVALIRDVASFPSFRRGAEIWADRAALLNAFHVAVSSDCVDNRNLVFVPVRIPVAVATGAAHRKNGLPAYSFSCADGGPTTQDWVLSPAEAGIVNTQMRQMDQYIRVAADRAGFAITSLDALYGLNGLKPAFSSVQLMTSQQPYGPYISLDGIHPSNAGHTILARAASSAIARRYGQGVFSTVVAAR
ncbi:MAG: hypothetical protein IT361_07835 [Gemmatimonadaceae bacterium]|nr:hypothetical protein [Gemmatimonadaceae bacterium]